MTCLIISSRQPFAAAKHSPKKRLHNTTRCSRTSGGLTAPRAERTASLTAKLPTALAPRREPLSVPPEITLKVVDIPPCVRLPPLVKHTLAKEQGLLSQTIVTAFNLPQAFVLELIRFGAVHWCPVPPEQPGKEGVLQLQEISPAFAARQAALKVFGKYPSHQTPRRAVQDTLINEHAYIRVHVHPRRCPAFYSADWQCRVVHDSQDYVVISKPPGVPVAPTVDNILECALTGAAQAIGYSGALLITHRLDRCTEGLTMIGKSPDFVRRFNDLLQNRKGSVRKFYRTLTTVPPPLGTMKHYATLNHREPGGPPHTHIHAHGSVPGSLYCELEVLQSEQLSVQDLPVGLQQSWPAPRAWESLLLLRTGRTHQIRAQFAAAGCPLYGDLLYERATSAVGGRTSGQNGDQEAGSQEALQEPESAIGLQACRLELDMHELSCPGLLRAFQDGPPWWRKDTLPMQLVLDWSYRQAR